MNICSTTETVVYSKHVYQERIRMTMAWQSNSSSHFPILPHVVPFYHLPAWYAHTSVSSGRPRADELLGSADRNFAPILEAIRPWIARSTSELDPTSSSSSSTEVPTDTTGSTSTGTGRAKILEIGSYPYAHIRGFAREFPHVQWYGSGRDDWEIE
jgi:hypothetical protein